MSDFEHDDLLFAAAADYRADTTPLIKPQGVVAAHQTVRHRKRVRTAAVAASVVTATLIGGAAYASLTGTPQRDPQPAASSTAVPVFPSPDDPSPSSSSSHAPTTVRLDAHALAEATIDLPVRKVGAQDCPSGPTKFHGGKAGAITEIKDVTGVDLDGDGTAEAAVLISCRPGEGGLGQVLGLRRTPSGGWTTLGVVAQVESGEGHGEHLASVTQVDSSKPGEVRVLVGDYETTYTDTSGGPIGLSQWRVYGWNGTAFAQTGGSPTFAFDRATAAVEVKVSPLGFGAAAGSRRKADLTVRLEMPSVPETDKPIRVLVSLPDGFVIDHQGCEQRDNWMLCDAGLLSPGAYTLFMQVSIPSGWSLDQVRESLGYSRVYVRVGDQEYGRYEMTATFS
ncbi:hypothetical protein Cs7R123_80340 [Catellatospora sp. TT07R-123]|uniref:hypothetical protein n=1 Tax=Catellatospora sp. TT07R-123 TaxID=2733863 RepID=UPI001B183DA5|nr:hypothetical protein [Catellatospora sp. TT07R-123]GHJ50674.1 hypothetical protein Cs7R123_80160 [Catellatospora sp. TT07R-123]GHJ50692.1 hypothetical protein Cs7R123_80340 [Catellatospora sp. TT07R-123]